MTAHPFVDGVGSSYSDELPKINTELLRFVLLWVIEQNNDDTPLLQRTEPCHNQAYWSTKGSIEGNICFSSFCFFGKGAQLAGGLTLQDKLSNFGLPMKTEVLSSPVIGWNGEVFDIAEDPPYYHSTWIEVGKILFGLTQDEAEELSSTKNTVPDLIALVKSIFSSRGEELGELSEFNTGE